jgi:hypothetical protein
MTGSRFEQDAELIAGTKHMARIGAVLACVIVAGLMWAVLA